MVEEVPLKPLSRSDIHKLETALMLATLLREDVLEKIKESTERLTWIDSLAVAAGALARAKAGMPVSKIADDLGRSEATIRRHLSEKSEAGKLIGETYKNFIKEGVKIELPSFLGYGSEEAEKLKKQVEKNGKRIKELEDKLNHVKNTLERLLREIS